MAIFGRDTPTERPNPGERGAIFVPNSQATEDVMDLLKKGAGLVGFGNPDGTLTLYFEANKFDDSSLFKWQDKVIKAYERMTKRSPTVNKLTAEPEHFVQIGIIEGTEILVREMDALRRYLERSNALATIPDSEHIFSGKQ